MHSLFERRRPGHASFFDRGLVSPVRCRKPVLKYCIKYTCILRSFVARGVKRVTLFGTGRMAYKKIK